MPLPLRSLPAYVRERVQGHARSASRAFSSNLVTLLLSLVMLVLIGLLLVNFVGQVMQNARLEDRRIALEAEVAALEARNTLRAGAVAFAESDVSVERIAREQLGFARDGDIVLLPQLPPLAPAASAPAAEDPAPAQVDAPPSDPNWVRWWDALAP